jgi:hypothetical protein
MNVLRVQHLWRIGILPISPSGRRAFPIHASLSPPSEITHNELGALTLRPMKMQTADICLIKESARIACHYYSLLSLYNWVRMCIELEVVRRMAHCAFIRVIP